MKTAEKQRVFGQSHLDKTFAYQLPHGTCPKKLNFKEARKLVKDDAYVYELKYDGRRYWLQIRPNKSIYNFLNSRHVSKDTGLLVEQQDKLPQVRDHKFPEVLYDTVLDGEWISEQEGAIASDVAHELSEGRGRFVCWDVVINSGHDMRGWSWTERHTRLEKLFRYMRARNQLPTWLKLAPTFDDPVELMKRVEIEQLEGGVRKSVSSAYGKDWTKIKAVEHFDCVIWGTEESKTSAEWRAKGIIGSIKIGQWSPDPRYKGCVVAKITNGSVPKPGDKCRHDGTSYVFVDCGTISGLKYDLRVGISRHPAVYLGQLVEVKAQQRLPSGLFRHPRFSRLRPDKNSWECLYVPNDEG